MESFKILSFLFFFFSLSNLFGQTIHSDSTYQKDAVYLGGTHYFENGILFKRGRWINKTKRALRDSPEAMKMYKESRNYNLTGLSIYAIGVGMYGAGHVMENEEIEWKSGFFAAGILSYLAMRPLAKRSAKKFRNAVWIHNNEMWLKHRKEGEFPKDSFYVHQHETLKRGQLFHGGVESFDFEKEFSTNPLAVEEYKKAKKYQRATGVLLKLGLASFLSSYWIDNRNWKQGLLLGGTGVALLGGIPLSRKSAKHFNNALWVYNNDQMLLNSNSN